MSPDTHYSLVIADDVKIMRESLEKIVDWESLGFKLEAVFSDGAQVIEYLKNNPLDVLLIDLKMITVSGLDVAAFIYEHSLPTKVVILTGHRDFEYAQKAIEYKVEHYLLKPISMPEMKRVFEIIRINLDKVAEREQQMDERDDAFNRLLDYEKEQFITEIAHGTLTDPIQLERRLALVGGELSELDLSCIRFELLLCESTQLQDLLNSYGKQGLRDYLTRILRTFDDGLDFYPLELFGLQMNGIMVEKVKGRLAGYEKDHIKFERAISRLINVALELDSRVKLIQYFSKLTDMSGYRYLETETNPDNMDEGTQNLLRQQKMLLMTYIIGMETNLARDCFVSFVNQSRAFGFDGCKNQTIYFFANVMVRVGEEFTETNDALMDLLRKVSFVDAAGLKTHEELIEWGQDRITWLTEQLALQGFRGSDKNIQKIKYYIEQNYSMDLTLAYMAEQVYMNPSYISRIFREKTGMTFSEYLADVRINAAARLLSQPSIYVYEVCERVGYHNIKHFYKIFKKKMGCSPSEYREKVLSE